MALHTITPNARSHKQALTCLKDSETLRHQNTHAFEAVYFRSRSRTEHGKATTICSVIFCSVILELREAELNGGGEQRGPGGNFLLPSWGAWSPFIMVTSSYPSPLCTSGLSHRQGGEGRKPDPPDHKLISSYFWSCTHGSEGMGGHLGSPQNGGGGGSLQLKPGLAQEEVSCCILWRTAPVCLELTSSLVKFFSVPNR